MVGGLEAVWAHVPQGSKPTLPAHPLTGELASQPTHFCEGFKTLP